MPERTTILAHLRRSRDGKAARRHDSNTQRRIAAGQLRLLDALIREIEAGAHLEPHMPEQTHTATPEADDLGFTATPARYAAHGRETIDRMRDLARATFASIEEADAAFAFHCRATALKYDDRAGLKGPAEADREKAAWYRQMADHVDGFAADPREGRPDFVPYAARLEAT